MRLEEKIRRSTACPWHLMKTPYFYKLVANFGVVVFIGLEIFLFLSLFIGPRDRLLVLVGFVSLGKFTQLSIAHYKEVVVNNNDFINGLWLTKPQAQTFLTDLEVPRPIYMQKIRELSKVWLWSTGSRNIHENIEFEDWINLSQKVEIRQKRKFFGTRKIYIEPVVEHADSFSHDEFENRKQDFIKQNYNWDPSKFLNYSEELRMRSVPEFILVSNESINDEPVIPWYYHKKLSDFCSCLLLGVCWQLILELITKSSAYYDVKSLSIREIDPQNKEQIEEMREKNKLML